MKQPKLNEINFNRAKAGILEGDTGLIVTMPPSQWDALLQTAYDRGAVLLEIVDVQPVKAYQ